MSQNFTDDCYDPDHVADTDLQNQEDNDLALKSCFSGSSAPSNPTAGMFWFNTSNGYLYQRNSGNTAWVAILDANNAAAFNLLRTITAGTGLSGGGELTADRTINHASHTGEVTGAAALTIANNVITPAKTSHGFVPICHLSFTSGIFSTTEYDSPGEEVTRLLVLMPSGPTIIDGAANIRNSDGGDNVYCRFTIGGFTQEVLRNASSFAWTSFSNLNVSGLTPGSTYELIVYLRTQHYPDTAFMRGFSLWWK